MSLNWNNAWVYTKLADSFEIKACIYMIGQDAHNKTDQLSGFFNFKTRDTNLEKALVLIQIPCSNIVKNLGMANIDEAFQISPK